MTKAVTGHRTPYGHRSIADLKAGRAVSASPCTDQSYNSLTSTILKFHKLKADCCIANVLGPRGNRFAIDNVAGSKFCFSDRTVSKVVADLSARYDIDDIGGMRVRLFLSARFKSRLENTYARVFEFQGDALWVYDQGILRTCNTRVAAHKSRH